jgi:hypothetical protein
MTDVGKQLQAVMLTIMLWLDVPAMAWKKRTSALTYRLVDTLRRDRGKNNNTGQDDWVIFDVDTRIFDMELLTVLQLNVLRHHAWSRNAYTDLDEGEDELPDTGEKVDGLKEQVGGKEDAGDEEEAEPLFETTAKQEQQLKEIQRAMISYSNNYPLLERRMQETEVTSHGFVLVFMQIKSEVENTVPINDQALTRIEEQELVLLSVLRKHVEQVAWRLTREGVIVEPPLGWNTSLNEDQNEYLTDNEKKEKKLIERLGFLLSNYCVQSWYWVTAPPSPKK